MTTIRRGSGAGDGLEPRRVLIVDDNADSAELLSLLLEREGHVTRIALHPREAIALAVEFLPHVAFLDIGLPGMDGYELLSVLRAAPELAACKFVAVTGYDSSGPGAHGFDAYLQKPIDVTAVSALVLETRSDESVA